LFDEGFGDAVEFLAYANKNSGLNEFNGYVAGPAAHNLNKAAAFSRHPQMELFRYAEDAFHLEQCTGVGQLDNKTLPRLRAT
jgi:hypothetical protein